MQPCTTADLQLENWAIIVEALVTWAGNPNDIEDPRADRAYELVEILAADKGCRPSELVAGRHHRRFQESL